MDASAGLTKNKKVPAPPPMPRPGLAVSRETARLGIGPVRRVIEPWTRPPDDIATGNAEVAARNRATFAPISLPALSANGARAGLGPDRTGPDSSGAGSDVPTRPDPKMSGLIASRVPNAEIGAAAELEHAQRMRIQTPPTPPTLSAAGARAGLGPFVTGSPGDAVKANAMAREIALSVRQVSANARALLMQSSTGIAAIRPLSDASARSGLTGNTPTAAAGKGFSMRVPKSPVAQDRERWASGTQARIAGASKGLGLAKSDWGDHIAPPRPQAKRTWVGVQGDATENPFDTGACSDLALPPHAAVNKSAAPLRELEKERVPSDVCPPLQSSIGTLEYMLRRDAHLAATNPPELLRIWSNRPSLLRAGQTAAIGGESLKSAATAMPASTAMKGLSAGAVPGAGCGCNDCGCNGGAKKTSAMAYANGAASKMMNARATGISNGGMSAGSTAMSAMSQMAGKAMPGGDELAALVESFAVRHGKDGNGEWFVPVFRRGGALVFGAEQRGPSAHGWHPDAMLGMKAGDVLVATIHTHSRSAAFSDDDRASGNALGVPMILIAPGAERARAYEPATGTIREMPVQGREKGRAWKPVAKTVQQGMNSGSSARRGRRTSSKGRGMMVAPSAARSITISQTTPPRHGVTYVDPNASYYQRAVSTSVALPSTAGAQQVGFNGAIADKRLRLWPPLIDPRLLARTVEIAAAHPDDPNNPQNDLSPELIWLELSSEWKNRPVPFGIPDPDLFRAIVAVAMRLGPGANPQDVLEQAKLEPLYVEPALLGLIINKAQQTPPLNLVEIWSNAWQAREAQAGWSEPGESDRIVLGSDPEFIGDPIPPGAQVWRLSSGPASKPKLPTPPDQALFEAIVNGAQFAKSFALSMTPQQILMLAHQAVMPLNPEITIVWPRYIATDLLKWIVFFAGNLVGARSDPNLLQAALYMVKYSGAPPEPQPDGDLLKRIADTSWNFAGADPFDILHHALAERLTEQLGIGTFGFPCTESDSCGAGLVCNWKGKCEEDTWSETVYGEQQTIPGDEIDSDWTDVVQGLATDGRFWYVTQGSGVRCGAIPDALKTGPCSDTNQMWKVPFNIEWDQEWGPLDWEALGIIRIDNGSFATKCLHWGDPDVYNGRVYLPLEDCPEGSPPRALALLDANTLEVLDMQAIGTDHAASVAIHPASGELYIEKNFYSPGRLWVFPPQPRDRLDLSTHRELEITNCPGNLVVTQIQGIAFSSSGKLYVSSDKDPDMPASEGGVYVFQVGPASAECMRYVPIEEHKDRNEELEGITVFEMKWKDGTVNQIHALLSHDRSATDWTGNAWFKHIRVDGVV